MEKGSFKYADPRKCFLLHENVLLAYLNYHGDAEAFNKMMRESKDGHCEDFDEYMRQIAEDRTIAQALLGWKLK